MTTTQAPSEKEKRRRVPWWVVGASLAVGALFAAGLFAVWHESNSTHRFDRARATPPVAEGPRVPARVEGLDLERGSQGCVAASGGAVVTFAVVRHDDAAGPRTQVQSLTVSNLVPSRCDGEYLVASLEGNATGDPSRPSATLWSFAALGSSGLDNCTARQLPGSAGRIQHGSVGVTFCATATRALADARSVTGVDLVTASSPTLDARNTGGHP